MAGLLDPPRSFPRPNRWFSGDDAQEVDSRGIHHWFLMDRASATIPTFLEPQAGETVLDMCAAPGGKSLILWELMCGAGQLVLNDTSPARRHRLRSVIDSYVPSEHRHGIRITGLDAARIGQIHPDSFDRVLLDAPCSSESHVLGSIKAMRQWSPARSRQLARRQFAMICSAVQALKPGGRLVYSTCSVCPWENDGVVQRLLRREKHPCRLVEVQSSPGDKTETGWIILPDRHQAGPMFFAVLEKNGVPSQAGY